MLHHFEISSLISVLVLGAILLAVVYHLILFYYTRDKLLVSYLAFLITAAVYVFWYTGILKNIASTETQNFFRRNFFEFTEVFYLVCYVFFIARALKLSPQNHPFLYYIWIFGNAMDAVYLTAVTYYTAVLGKDYHQFILYEPVRVVGLVIVIIILVGGIRMKNLTFEKIILYGAFAYMFFYILCMVSSLNFSDGMLVFPPEWLITGLFVDVLFFSNAINYRNKLQWKEVAKKQLEASQNIIKFQKEALQKQEDIENERARIASDMHDDLGSELTKINYLSQMAMNSKNPLENLEKIKQTTGSLVQNMSNLIWAMKEENNSLQDLVFYLKNYSCDYLENNGIKLKFSVCENLKNIELRGDLRRNIFLAIKEILHNTVKHSKADTVEIAIENDRKLTIKITDNGIGFTDKDLQKNIGGNGLINIKKRIEKIGGIAKLHSESGKTEHIFEIPV